MDNQDIFLLRKLKERLAGKIHLVEMRLFGSRARGDSNPDSDVDVFIEVERLDNVDKILIKETAWEIGLNNGRVITPLIFTRDELVNSPLRSSPIVASILREGIPI